MIKTRVDRREQYTKFLSKEFERHHKELERLNKKYNIYENPRARDSSGHLVVCRRDSLCDCNCGCGCG